MSELGYESRIIDGNLVQGLGSVIQWAPVIPYLERLQSLEEAVLTMLLGSVTMGSSQPYLAQGPTDLLESCDVLLKLDDGTELPVHSQILARCMSVFSGMVATGGPLSKASADNVISVPFNDCSMEDASLFLSAVYSSRALEHLQKSALSNARLSHKYGGEVRSYNASHRADYHDV